MKDMRMTISLKCSVCGNDQFSAIDESIIDIDNADDDIQIKCSDCGRVTTKAELIEENSDIIDANVEDFKEESREGIKKDI